MAGRLRIALPAAAVLVGVLVGPAIAQTGGGQSGGLSVSVLVVRPCTVVAPTAVDKPSTQAGTNIRLSCGRAPSGTSLLNTGVVPVSGAPTSPTVATTKNEHGLVVSVDF